MKIHRRLAVLVPALGLALTIAALMIGNTSWFYGFYTYGWFSGSILGGLIYYIVAGGGKRTSQ